MSWAALSWTDITWAELIRAELTWLLTNVELTRTELTWAELTRAELTRADLTSAELTWADVTWLAWHELKFILRKVWEKQNIGMKYYGSVVKVKLDINLLTKNFRYHIRTNYWPQVPIQWSLTGGKVVKSPQKLQLWPIFTGGNIGFCLFFLVDIIVYFWGIF